MHRKKRKPPEPTRLELLPFQQKMLEDMRKAPQAVLLRRPDWGRSMLQSTFTALWRLNQLRAANEQLRVCYAPLDPHEELKRLLELMRQSRLISSPTLTSSPTSATSLIPETKTGPDSSSTTPSGPERP